MESFCGVHVCMSLLPLAHVLLRRVLAHGSLSRRRPFSAMAGFYDELFTAPDTLKYFVKGEWKVSKSGKTVRRRPKSGLLPIGCRPVRAAPKPKP